MAGKTPVRRNALLTLAVVGDRTETGKAENVMGFLSRLAAPAMVVALVLPAAAENGVNADTVRFAQVAALDGPAAALGSGIDRKFG